MPTITKERRNEIRISLRNWGKDGIDVAAIFALLDVLDAAEAKMGEPAKPVAWTDKTGLDFLAKGCGIDVSAERGTMGRTTALYTAPPAAEPAKTTHRHKKRGTEYVLIGYGKMQAENWFDLTTPTLTEVSMHEVAIYRSVDDGTLWVRPREEFEDGRFEPLSAAPVLGSEKEAE